MKSRDWPEIPALKTAREIAKRDHPSLAKAAEMYKEEEGKDEWRLT